MIASSVWESFRVWECFKAWEDERTSKCEKTSSIWEGRGGRVCRGELARKYRVILAWRVRWRLKVESKCCKAWRQEHFFFSFFNFFLPSFLLSTFGLFLSFPFAPWPTFFFSFLPFLLSTRLCFFLFFLSLLWTPRPFFLALDLSFLSFSAWIPTFFLPFFVSFCSFSMVPSFQFHPRLDTVTNNH